MYTIILLLLLLLHAVVRALPCRKRNLDNDERK